MEKFQELRDVAKKKIYLADYMLTQTYPLIQDTRLLLAVLENIFLALTNAMGSVLYYERLFKRIPPFHDNFDSKFNMFRANVVDKYKVKGEHINLIQHIKDVIVEHKKSPVEFTRKDMFVICSDDYRMKTVSVEDIKKYVIRAKSFIEETSNIVSKNEGIFR
ncbi:hypothetical protein J4209_06235 [Candidatus Woesearchaeota archaeon]|nr:hypothetical protein [Candidatus Woesearchaeota archaeon]